MSSPRSLTISEKAEGFDWAFGPLRLSLSALGVWPSENNPLRWRNTIITPILVVVMFSGLVVPQLSALVKIHRQLMLVADNIVTFNVCVSAMTKISILWMGRKETAELLRRVYEDWLADKSSSDLGMMRRQAGRGRVLAIFGLCLCLGCVTGFIVSPIFHISIRQFNNITDHPTRSLPVQAYYPYYNVYRSPIYEFTFLHQAVAGIFAATSQSAPDNFFSALVFHACAQCEILAASFERLAANAPAMDSVTFVEQLRGVVSRHVRLIRFVDGVESLFNMMILAHVVYVVVTSGLLGFLCVEAFVGDADSLPLIQVVTLSATSFTMLLLSLVICGAVEMLATRSCRLLETTYLPNLHSMPKSRARDLMMIMMHSREPLKLTAGKLVDLSLNTYLQLIKNVFGYISMLITMNQSH